LSGRELNYATYKEVIDSDSATSESIFAKREDTASCNWNSLSRKHAHEFFGFLAIVKKFFAVFVSLCSLAKSDAKAVGGVARSSRGNLEVDRRIAVSANERIVGFAEIAIGSVSYWVEVKVSSGDFNKNTCITAANASYGFVDGSIYKCIHIDNIVVIILTEWE
jgi:hypothetical protein